MLVCSGTDEYNQFPVVMEMISTDGSVEKTIMGIIDYGHYYYGSPFYFISALALIPIKAYSKIQPANYTWLYVLILRQLGTLFISLSIIALVSMWTRFKNLFASITLFLFLGSLPAIVSINTGWRVDSMVTFFVIATIYCLWRDKLRFHTFFYIAAVFCGLAITTKTVGVFFGFCIIIYLLLGYFEQSIKPMELIRKSAAFLGIMIVAILASHPVLLIPGRAQEVFQTVYNQSQVNTSDWGIPVLARPIWHYQLKYRDAYAHWLIFATALLLGVGCKIKVDHSFSRLTNRNISFLTSH